ncbi:uncharacterized protein LOC121889690 [Xyrichtys novacula]|uniref:Uncharacterized protein LOC121889690 n=1 Tax=Xyrichtys novacula TaxID=13765 RepID=A0AAV1EHS9_XYRNO|nr:uncharacterized protein LOC121889690 [Xyrichtys novacula]
MQANHSQLFSTNSSDYLTCSDGILMFISLYIYNTLNILVFLPLYALVFWKSFQRWRNQTTGTTSHSDIFTYCIISMEILGVLASNLFYFGFNKNVSLVNMVGYFSLHFAYAGQTLFHCLTCMERHLAVCHPITYRALRRAGGVKVRNISIGCAWLLCLALTGSTFLYFPDFPTVMSLVALGLTLLIVCFCSLSVLRALVHLGLRKVGGTQKQIDQSKMRALHTVMAIMITQVLRFCGLAVSIVIFGSLASRDVNICLLQLSVPLLCLPTNPIKKKILDLTKNCLQTFMVHVTVSRSDLHGKTIRPDPPGGLVRYHQVFTGGFVTCKKEFQ